MKQAIALVFLVTAACVSPAGETGSERENNAVLPEPHVASRSYPAHPTSRIADYLLVDKSDRMLVAYSNGQPIRVYYGLQFGDAPMGHKRFEGDERTPEGIYTVHTRNPNSSFHLSLRIDYPNSRDRAFAAQYGRSAGGDIFIHGQPNGLPSNRRMRGDWTDGCIALTNAEIEELWSIVPDGTPIEIRQ